MWVVARIIYALGICSIVLLTSSGTLMLIKKLVGEDEDVGLSAKTENCNESEYKREEDN